MVGRFSGAVSFGTLMTLSLLDPFLRDRFLLGPLPLDPSLVLSAGHVSGSGSSGTWDMSTNDTYDTAAQFAQERVCPSPLCLMLGSRGCAATTAASLLLVLSLLRFFSRWSNDMNLSYLHLFLTVPEASKSELRPATGNRILVLLIETVKTSLWIVLETGVDVDKCFARLPLQQDATSPTW